MIGRLQGTVIDLGAPFALIDCHGVGYEVEMPLPAYCQLRVGQTATLWTHLVVREDAHLLYGFSGKEERLLFRLLLKVTGVGPKLALSLLSGMEPAMFLQCIEREDIANLTRIPGVGKKTAERLVIELRDKVGELSGDSRSSVDAARPTLPKDAIFDDALSALVNLGYQRNSAEKALNQAAKEGTEISVQKLLRRSLQILAK